MCPVAPALGSALNVVLEIDDYSRNHKHKHHGGKRHHHHANSKVHADSESLAASADVLMHQANANPASAKGPIALLQEFVQCSKQYHLPHNRSVLQWEIETRSSAPGIQSGFRATVAFLLDAIPHHIKGNWCVAKKVAQRDAAERALGLFVGCWGGELLERGLNDDAIDDGATKAEVQRVVGTGGALEGLWEVFHARFPACAGSVEPKWTCSWNSDGECQAIVEIVVLNVVHQFAGSYQKSVDAAHEDTLRRVFWYLQCPGFEHLFEPNPSDPKVTADMIEAPPSQWQHLLE